MCGRDCSRINQRLRNFQLLADFAELRGKCSFARNKLVAVGIMGNLIAYENDHAGYVTQAATRKHRNKRNVWFRLCFCRNKACESFDIDSFF